MKAHSLLDDGQALTLKAAAIAGCAVFAAGLKLDPARAWSNLLLANFYFLGLALGALVFVAIHHACSAGWPVVLRRIPEAMAGYLPIGGLIMLGLYFGLHDLYHWSHAEAAAHDSILSQKTWLLNPKGFMFRTALFAALWYAFYKLLIWNSRAQDNDGDVKRTHTGKWLSVSFLVVFAPTFSISSVDWIMSLDPHWYSTIFPWYVFSGIFVHAAAALAVLLIVLKRRGLLKEVNEHHLHDLGKYVFAFSVFWAYLWFSQFLLIWYSNIPEETTYYALRWGKGWMGLFWVNLAVNFLAPFALLLSARAKKRVGTLLAAGVALLIGHWFDLYLMVMPASMHEGPKMGWLELGLFAGLGALFLLAFDRCFKSAPAAPERDPYLEESLHFGR